MATTVQTFLAQNENSNTVNIRFTDDGTGGNAVERVYIFANCGDVSQQTLPGTMTLSKQYTDPKNFYGFFGNVPCRVLSMKLLTDSPNDNFNEVMKIGYSTPSQDNVKTNDIDLNTYATTIGSSLSDSLVLNDLNWVVLSNFFCYVDIKKGTYLDIRLEIDMMQQSADLTPIKF